MKLRTEPRLAMGGEAIARAPDGRVVFVSGAAPEEEVEVEITEDAPRLLRARVLRVVTPGPSRVEPRCKHFGICGGCALQHVGADVQREAKSAAFAETLRRIGGVDLASLELEPPWAGPAYGYRTRARMAFSRGVLGYRARRKNTLVDVEECPILDPLLEAAIPRVRTAIDRRDEGEIDLVVAAQQVLGAVRGGARLGPIEGVEVGGEARVDEAAGVRRVSAAEFQQSNQAGNEALIETVERWTASGFSGDVLELYAGGGNFTRVLARRAARVVAVEAAGAALTRAVLPASVERRARSSERAVEELAGEGRRFDAALVDPPRAGLEASIPAGLARLGVRALLMISCDPATFARDTRRLAEQGLALARARLFDFYPQTGHAEVAGLFLPTTFALVGSGRGG